MKGIIIRIGLRNIVFQNNKKFKSYINGLMCI